MSIEDAAQVKVQLTGGGGREKSYLTIKTGIIGGDEVGYSFRITIDDQISEMLILDKHDLAQLVTILTALM